MLGKSSRRGSWIFRVFLAAAFLMAVTFCFLDRAARTGAQHHYFTLDNALRQGTPLTGEDVHRLLGRGPDLVEERADKTTIEVSRRRGALRTHGVTVSHILWTCVATH